MTPIAQPVFEVRLTEAERLHALQQDARQGLTAADKRLSPIWFYDERGSLLFEQITRLPEYYLTRAELSLLTAHSPDIAERTRADTLVELGAGYAEKTRVLIDALATAGSLKRYVPLDVAPEALHDASHRLLADHPALHVHAVVADFHRHLDDLPGGRRRLIAFLGSTIGNLYPAERHAFLRTVARDLRPDDRLLLGCDLVKDPARLVAAYDDASGVTAEFNRNALRVVNRQLGADFVPEEFDHVARWNARERWIEVRLRARRRHAVRLEALDLQVGFEPGEELLTEISAKFAADEAFSELAAAGLAVEAAWQASGDFLLTLARPLQLA